MEQRRMWEGELRTVTSYDDIRRTDMGTKTDTCEDRARGRVLGMKV